MDTKHPILSYPDDCRASVGSSEHTQLFITEIFVLYKSIVRREFKLNCTVSQKRLGCLIIFMFASFGYVKFLLQKTPLRYGQHSLNGSSTWLRSSSIGKGRREKQHLSGKHELLLKYHTNINNKAAGYRLTLGYYRSTKRDNYSEKGSTPQKSMGDFVERWFTNFNAPDSV